MFDTPWRYHAAFLGVAGIAATLLLTWGDPLGTVRFQTGDNRVDALRLPDIVARRRPAGA